MKVKICGITRTDDALAAVDLGADALGFIFVPGSPRMVTPDQAARIIRRLPSGVVAVGVFRNAAREAMLKVATEAGLGTLQLHGEELPQETQGYPLPVWKAFGVDASFVPEALSAYTVEACVLDTRSGGETGGTGRPFDWSVAVRAAAFGRIVLAGGITPDNAAEAAAVRPWALDVNSGVESCPGRKDHALLRRLFASLRTVTH